MTWIGPNYVEVQTAERVFRSGLIESSWRRTCQADQVSAALSVSSNSFPEPSVRYEDGLAVVEWTEYDKKNSTGFQTKGAELINLSKSYESTQTTSGSGGSQITQTYRWTVTEIWISDTITTTKVINASESSATLNASGSTAKTMIKRIILGNPAPSSGGALQISWSSQVVSVNRRNYGLLDEVEITVGNVPTLT